tara:strand:- start:81 stop:206 length:126 start_codon:yes stop_codon:yes gene_type:complete
MVLVELAVVEQVEQLMVEVVMMRELQEQLILAVEVVEVQHV